MNKLGFKFDAHIAIDWSASSVPSSAKPAADAIWLGVRLDGLGEQSEIYFRTRHECVIYLRGLLIDLVSKGLRVLVGYDFDFGFPRGFAEALGCTDEEPWRYTWQHLTSRINDQDDNRNNRFEVAGWMNDAVRGDNAVGPLWGKPAKLQLSSVSAKSPGFPYVARGNIRLRSRRWCELHERKAQPIWKLLGTASVGGQSLVGIPKLNSLRVDHDLSKVSRIWPFETGFSSSVLDDDSVRVVHIEIWPGLIGSRLNSSLQIKDQAQVRAVVDWFCALEEKGQLPWLFEPPRWLSSEQISDAESEEGWVVGSGQSGLVFPEPDGPRQPVQGNLF